MDADAEEIVKAEDGGRKTEDGGPKTEDRRRRTEDGGREEDAENAETLKH